MSSDLAKGLWILHNIIEDMQKLILDLVEQHHIKLGFDKWRIKITILRGEYHKKFIPNYHPYTDNIYYESIMIKNESAFGTYVYRRCVNYRKSKYNSPSSIHS